MTLAPESPRTLDTVEADLRDSSLLRDLAVRLASEQDLSQLYMQVVAAAMALSGAEAGTIQLFDEETQELVIVGTHGFPPAVTEHFRRIDASSNTSCGLALGANRRVALDFDTAGWEQDETRRLHVESGYRAAQSTPLVTREGTPIGMVSTHWKESGSRPTARQERFLDLLALQVASVLELRRSEQRLRESRELLERELADTRLVQRLSATLVQAQGVSELHDALLDAAMTIMQADFASLQRLDAPGGEPRALELLASRNFTSHASAHWKRVPVESGAACGRALRAGSRIVVEDVEAAGFAPDSGDLATYREAGIRSVQSTPLVSRSGKPVGMMSTHWRVPHAPSERQLRFFDLLARQAADLMERSDGELALRESEARLREADRRKDEFLAMLAHELRNPLAPIRTGLELIRVAGDSRESVQNVRGMMERQVGHMVRLVDDLLDVSRITSGKIRLQRAVAPLDTLVHAAVEANRGALSAVGIAFELSLPESPVWLDVDATRFVQVVGNVLQNAIKFTPAGGRIGLRATVDDATLVLEVADSGSGIAPGILPHVFDLFVQDGADAPGTRTGLGIGLALARRLVEMHGGTIDAASAGRGKGSVFTICLPVSAAPAVSAGGDANRPEAVSTRRVLVVDDNRDAADSMVQLVRGLGGQARVAYDGTAGLAEAEGYRPELVFLDIGMPGLDGYETCRRLRALLGPGTTLVALSGWGQEQDKEAARSAGFDAHLTKPADPATLGRFLRPDPDAAS